MAGALLCGEVHACIQPVVELLRLEQDDGGRDGAVIALSDAIVAVRLQTLELLRHAVRPVDRHQTWLRLLLHAEYVPWIARRGVAAATLAEAPHRSASDLQAQPAADDVAVILALQL